MKTIRFLTLGLAVALVVFLATPGSAQEQKEYQKLAQTGFKFLTVGQNARQAALADAFTAVVGTSASMFYNPAGMGDLPTGVDVSFGETQWIGDIKHQHLAIAFKLPRDLFGLYVGDLGTFGFNYQFVDYGIVEQTIIADNAMGYLDVGTFKPSAYALGISYARSLTNKFSVGGTVKVTEQNLGTGITEVTYEKKTMPDGAQKDTGFVATQTREMKRKITAYDLGILYKTGFKSLTFGMSIKNFSEEISFIKETFQLPLTFRIGLSMNLLDLAEMDPMEQSLLLTVDAEHPRDYKEQFKVGLEYTFMNMISLRLGYIDPADEHNISYGLGFHPTIEGIRANIDYSYTPFGIFEKVQRFTFGFQF